MGPVVTVKEVKNSSFAPVEVRVAPSVMLPVPDVPVAFASVTMLPSRTPLFDSQL